MFKGQPKGLFVLALANMGERFGYYTMLAIFVLYMQAKFGFTTDQTSTVFGVFLAAVYFMPLFGGILADKALGYGKTIALGIGVMFCGYLLLAYPSQADSTGMFLMFGALVLIAAGTGCFKGNLQALVGNMYDDPKYSSKRDLAFSIFYMCINVGAFFAPSAAEGVSNYFMKQDNSAYTYNANVPALYHQLNNKEISPQAYVTLASYAKTQGTVAYDPALMACYSDSTAAVDSTTAQWTVADRFGAVLSPAECAKLDTTLNQDIEARFGLFVAQDQIPVAAIRSRVLALISTPVADSTALHQMVMEHVTTKDDFAPNDGLTDEAEYKQMIGKYATVTAQVKGLLNTLVNEQAARLIDEPVLLQFSAAYTDSMSKSFNYAFAVACLSLIVSMLIFLVFRRTYAKADQTEKQKAALKAMGKSTESAPVVELTAAQVKDRMVALGLVFAVVIFFWMAFHQNGLTMTFFARDYTQTSVSGFDRFGFSLLTLLPFAVCFYGLLSVFQSTTNSGKGKSAVVALLGAGLAYWAYDSMNPSMSITPQIFQQFNAYFIVILTPLAVAFFSWLNKKGREPLAPRKIGIGMIIAALGFVVLVLGSIGLPTPHEADVMGGVPADLLVSPNWLISTYFILTIAELFLSPMGISFVSKVAPPKYKGLAQGGWLAATAIGNYLVAVVGYLWGGLPLWLVWGILVVLCLLSATFLFSQMKKLERTTRDA